jgi:hypothetical protein
LLEVVDDEQQVLGSQKAFDRAGGRFAREHDDLELRDDRGGHVLGPGQCGERDEVRAFCEVGVDGARGLEREPRLADAAGASQGQQPHRARPEPLDDRAYVVVATDRAVRRNRHAAVTRHLRRCRRGAQPAGADINRRAWRIDARIVAENGLL